MVKPDHLHGTDFESCTKDGIHNQSDSFSLDQMWLDDAEGAVFIVRTRLNMNFFTLTSASLEKTIPSYLSADVGASLP